MSLVHPYGKLRKDLTQRDRSLREKVVSLEEAASFVHDGHSVGIGGSTRALNLSWNSVPPWSGVSNASKPR